MPAARFHKRIALYRHLANLTLGVTAFFCVLALTNPVWLLGALAALVVGYFLHDEGATLKRRLADEALLREAKQAPPPEEQTL